MFAFGCALSALGACSLINAPDDVKPGGSGGAGGSGGMTGEPCQTEADCTAPSDPCLVAKCSQGQCTTDQAPNNTPCDDGLVCTDGDICVSGQCTAGPPKQCTPSNQCKAAVCDEAAMGCVEMDVPDGTACDDNDLCTNTSDCQAGVCVPGPGCKDTECTTGMCTPTGCMDTPKPMGTTCGVTPCSTGQCGNDGKCLITPINVGQPCDDGLFCSSQDKCNQFGQCEGTAETCLKPGPCVEATCNEDMDTCDLKPILNGEVCDDGNGCTSGETCLNNVCSGGTPPQVLFTETFANNSKGWTLGNEWAIGPAMASTGGVGGTADPASDHTTTSDNGVAGVVIGGNAATMTHPMSYIESPAVDVSMVNGKLYVTYWRWLNSDYTPFMRNVVEVFDGMNWVEVWTSGGPPGVRDSPPTGQGWTFMSHEISMHKNAALKVRFGFDVGSSGVYTIGSWNLDDVKIQTAPCNM